MKAATDARGLDVRDPILWIAAGLLVIAFGASLTHIRDIAGQNGATGAIKGVRVMALVIALLPVTQELLVILKIRKQGLSWTLETWPASAWLMVIGGSALAFTVAANLATIKPGSWGGSIGQWHGWPAVVAIWPAWAALTSASLVDLPAGVRKVTGKATEKAGTPPSRLPAKAVPPAPAVVPPHLPSGPQPPGDPTWLGAPRGGTARERILAHLARPEVADATRAELAEALGIPGDTVKSALPKLVAEGKIAPSDRKDAYRLARPALAMAGSR